MNRVLIALLMIIFFVVVVSADSLEGKWTINPYYGPVYEFNETFLNEVFDDRVGPGIADANIMGISFDYAKTETTTISLSFSFAENDIHDVDTRTEVTYPEGYPVVQPHHPGVTSTYSWDVTQNIDFKAFTISIFQRIRPQNRVVPYFGIGVGVCQASGNVEGEEDSHHYRPSYQSGYDPDGTPYYAPESDISRHEDYDDNYSGIYPVLDARVGLDWHVTEKFILSVEERFVNGLGTMIVGKYVF